MKRKRIDIKTERRFSGKTIIGIFESREGFRKEMEIPTYWLNIRVKIPILFGLSTKDVNIKQEMPDDFFTFDVLQHKTAEFLFDKFLDKEKMKALFREV